MGRAIKDLCDKVGDLIAHPSFDYTHERSELTHLIDRARAELENAMAASESWRRRADKAEARVRELEEYLSEIRGLGGREFDEELIDGLVDEALANSEKEPDQQ